MRAIALVVRPAAGGIRRHVSQLIGRLDRSRFIPSLFAPSGFTLDEAGPACPLIERKTVEIRASTNPYFDLQAGQDLACRLPVGCSIIHAHGIRAAIVAAIAARRTRIPLIVTVHNLVDPKSPLARLAMKWIDRQVRYFVVVSHAVEAGLISCGIPQTKIVVVSNGIDLAWIDQNAAIDTSGTARSVTGPTDTAMSSTTSADTEEVPATDRPFVAAVGRLSIEKGFDVLIRAMAIVRKTVPGATLVIAGDGPEQQALTELANRLDAGVHFAGSMPDIRSLLRSAALVAIPSRQEGQGIVALEAMALSRPVVAARVGGLVETVIPGKTGLLVDPESDSSLAEAILNLLSDEPLREQLGRAGRQAVESHYGIEAMVSKIEALYDAAATQ